jgi:hypothetical protein
MTYPRYIVATRSRPGETVGDDERAYNLALRALGLLAPGWPPAARADLTGPDNGRDAPTLPTLAQLWEFEDRLRDEIVAEFGPTHRSRSERLVLTARRAAEAARLRAAVSLELAWRMPAAWKARAELAPLVYSRRSARKLATITRFSREVDRLRPAVERREDAVARLQVAAGMLDQALREQPLPSMSHPPKGGRAWPTRALELLEAGNWWEFVGFAVEYAANALPNPAIGSAPRAGGRTGVVASVTRSFRS